MRIVKIKFIITALILILFLNSAYCDEIKVGKKINIHEAMNLAVEENLKLFQTEKNVEIARNKIKQANRLQNPYIDGIGRFGNASANYPQQFGAIWTYEIFKRGPRKRTAIAESDVAKTEFSYRAFLLKIDVRRTYIELTEAKSILKIAKEQRAILEKMADSALERFKAGIVPEREYLQARIFLDQWATVMNAATTHVMTARYRFNKTLNLDNNDEYAYDTMEDSLPNIGDGDFSVLLTPSPKADLKSYEEIEAIAFEHRKDIEIAKKEVTVAQKDLIVQLHKRIPDLTFSGGYMILTAAQNRIKNGDTALSGAYAGVSILLPSLYLFTPEIRNAKLEIEKKEANLKAVMNIARQDLRAAYAEFMLARKNLNYYMDVLLDESKQVAKQAQKAYTVGNVDLADLIIMERLRVTMLTDYINILGYYYVTWVELLGQANVESLD